jgi:hypothetical protein
MPLPSPPLPPFSKRTTFTAALLLGVCFAALPGQSASPAKQGTGQTGNKTAQVAARALRFEVQLTRTDKGGAVPVAEPSKEAPKEDAGQGTPIIVGAPVLNTLDRNTASVAVNGTATSYNVALSPTLEKSDTTVQVLWNLRVSGKDFPGGASAFTLSGANRLTLGTETLVGEIPINDKTGRVSTFKLILKATLTDMPSAQTPQTPSTVPVTGTLP